MSACLSWRPVRALVALARRSRVAVAAGDRYAPAGLITPGARGALGAAGAEVAAHPDA